MASMPVPRFLSAFFTRLITWVFTALFTWFFTRWGEMVGAVQRIAAPLIRTLSRVMACNMRSTRRMSRSFLSVLLVMASACASSSPSVPVPTSTTPAKVFLRDGSVPGFDKRDFPGIDAMRVWMRESPYVWVGYYLQSPCFAGAAWTGNRAALEAQGWGLAVLYVGQQAPGATPNSGRTGAPDCGKKPLTAAQGEIDGEQAVTVASADGFPTGSTIFLNVERADPFPPALGEYVRGWSRRVLARGFIAGMYAHKLNAENVSAIQRETFSAANVTVTPPFWVANSIGFALGKLPAESGYGFATAWQNPSDANETWGGVTFRIDQNVASKRTP